MVLVKQISIIEMICYFIIFRNYNIIVNITIIKIIHIISKIKTFIIKDFNILFFSINFSNSYNIMNIISKLLLLLFFFYIKFYINNITTK